VPTNGSAVRERGERRLCQMYSVNVVCSRVARRAAHLGCTPPPSCDFLTSSGMDVGGRYAVYAASTASAKFISML